MGYNNVGRNNSTFEYLNNSQNFERQKEDDFYAKKVLPESMLISNLEESKTNNNNQFFSNYNSIFKLSKKSSLKTNFFYLEDDIYAEQKYINRNFIEDNVFSTSDSFKSGRKPNFYKLNLDFKSNVSKKSLLEFFINSTYGKSLNNSTILQNEIKDFQSNLKTESFLFKSKLIFTHKLKDNRVLQFTGIQSINNAPQNLTINPTVFNNDLEGDLNKQESKFKKERYSYLLTYLSAKGNTKYSSSLGGVYEVNPYKSNLSNFNGIAYTLIDGFENNMKYKKNHQYITNSLSFKWKGFKISSALKLSFLNQSLNNELNKNLNQKEDSFIWEPSLEIGYKISNSSVLIGSSNYSYNTFSESYLYSNPIITDNRLIKLNSPSLDLQRVFNIGAYYYVNNLFDQLELNLGVNYSKTKGDFFSNINIQENSTIVDYFYLNQYNSNSNFNFSVKKYVPWLISTIGLRTDFSVLDYKNIVNNSDLRSNTSNVSNFEFFYKSSYDFFLNFETASRYTNMVFKNGNANNSIDSFNNSFKLMMKPSKKWLFELISNFYVPNTDSINENYNFLDALIRFTPKSEAIDLSLISKNVLNERFYNSIQTSDYSTSIQQVNLLPRYFMLKAVYRF